VSLAKSDNYKPCEVSLANKFSSLFWLMELPMSFSAEGHYEHAHSLLVKEFLDMVIAHHDLISRDALDVISGRELEGLSQNKSLHPRLEHVSHLDILDARQ
jgi:hypothetical protein